MGFFGGGGASVDLASPPAIGSTTPNTGAFTTLSFAPAANTTGLSSSSYSLTGSNAQSLVSLAGTWNTTGTPTAVLLNITDTASNASSILMGMQIGGANRFQFLKDGRLRFNVSGTGILNSSNSGIEFVGDDVGIRQNNSTGAYKVYFANAVGLRLGNNYYLGWSNGTYADNSFGTIDLTILRDGADALAQRRSTNAQTFRLYNTFTDASNYERVDLRWTSNVFEINTRNGAAGTGTARNVHITIPNNGAFQINGGVGGGELFGIRNSYMGTAYGAEIGATGWRSAIRCLNFVSDRGISWSNSTSSLTTADCAIVRNSAGVLEINDGNTTGTFRDLIVRNFRMSAPTGVPTANNSTGTEGSIRWDADYIYICTATNTWKRVAIATW